MNQNFKNTGDEIWLPLSEAYKGTPYSAEYLSLRARQGKLEAKKIDDVWHTTTRAIAEYRDKKYAKKSRAVGETESWMPLSEVAKLTPYSAEYLSLLARQKKLFAKKIDEVWHTTIDALTEYADKQVLAKEVARRENSKRIEEEKPPFRHKIIQSYVAETLPLLPKISKAGKYVPPVLTARLILSSTTLALALVVSLLAGLGTLERTSPTLARNLNHEVDRVSLALVSASDSIGLFFSGFKELRDLAFAVFTSFGEEPTVSTPSTPLRTDSITPTRIAIITQAPQTDFSSLRSDLKSELLSYIDSQISTAGEPRVVYQPVRTEILREEILLADTRPTVTRQSTSDIDHIGSALSALTDGGSFTGSTITNSSITGSTFSGSSGNFTSLTFGNATGTSLYLSGSASIDGALDVGGNTVTLGQLISTRIPTLAHSFSPWPSGTSNASDATIYINPASAAPDTNIFAAAVAGTVKFLVDAEGDVYANNLILSGSTSQGETTIAGNLTVQDSATLGDASSDTLTVNAHIIANASTTLSDLIFTNATGTSATTTSFFSTTASSTNLFTSALTVNGYNFTVNGAPTLNNWFDQSVKTTASPTFANLTLSSALSVANGGTGQTSFGQGWLHSDGTTFTASTSPTINYFTATSTTATSTISTGGFAVGTSQFVVQQTSGNVGIGTTDPGTKLSISGSGTGGAIGTVFQQETVNTGGALGDWTGTIYRWIPNNANTNQAYIGAVVTSTAVNTLSDLVFGVKANTTATAITEYMRIQGGGNVGIGTTNPSTKLNISGTAEIPALGSAGGTFSILRTGNDLGLFAGQNAAGNAWLQVQRSDTLTNVGNILLQPNGGNVGIGTTGPNELLNIYASSAANVNNVFRLQNAHNGNDAVTLFYGNTDAGVLKGSELGFDPDAYGVWIGNAKTDFFVAGGGNVGIGTTNPGAQDDEGDDFVLNSSSATGNGMTIVSPTTGRGHILFADGPEGSSAAYRGSITYDHGTGMGWGTADAMGFRTAGTVQMVINNLGNVGIGETSPVARLDIVNAVTTSTLDDTNYWLRLGGGGGSTGNLQKIGLGYLSSSSTESPIVIGSRTVTQTGNTTASFFVATRSTTGSGDAPTERFTVDPSGNVGIGTTGPRQKLEANTVSTGVISGTTNRNPVLQISNRDGAFTANTGAAIDFGTGVDGDEASIFAEFLNAGSGYGSKLHFATKPSATNTLLNRMTIDSTGNVGIGMTNPGVKLQVAGGDFSVDATKKLYLDGVSSTYLSESSDGVIDIVTNGNKIQFADTIIRNGDATNEEISIRSGSDNAGGVGTFFGSTNAVLADYIRMVPGTNGVQLSSGATSWSSISDERLKTPLTSFVDATGKLSSLRTGTGRYLTDAEDVSRSFLIAQDVQMVLPEAVDVAPDSGYLSLRYTDLIPLIIAAIQEIADISDSFSSNLIAFFADAANGIGDFFANRVHTKELCVGDGAGETCITRAQLDSMLASVGTVTITEVMGGGGSTVASDTPIATTDTASSTPDLTQTPPVLPLAGEETVTTTDTASSTPTTTDTTSTTTPDTVIATSTDMLN